MNRKGHNLVMIKKNIYRFDMNYYHCLCYNNAYYNYRELYLFREKMAKWMKMK